MEEQWYERQRELELLEDRVKRMESENRLMETGIQDKQHQLELHFRDMEEKYTREREADHKRLEERVRELERKCQLECRAKVLEMEHLLQRERMIGQRKQQVLLRLIELGQIAKMRRQQRCTGTNMGREQLSVLNAQTELKQGKEHCHDTERCTHSTSSMRVQGERAERRVENDPQKEKQWEEKRSQEMAEKLKEMKQKFEMDKKRREEKWMEMEKKSQEEWNEKVRNLEKKLENEKEMAKQRQQEFLRHKEEKEKAKNEELLWMARHRESEMNTKQIVEQTHRKTEQEKSVLKGKESMREIEHKERKRTDTGSDLQNAQKNLVNKEPDMYMTEKVKVKEQPFFQDTRGDIKEKVAEKEDKPAEQMKPHTKEMDWLTEMRPQAVENKDINKQKNQPFLQDRPKESAENAAVKPVAEKQQPVQEIEWLREFKPKQGTEVDSKKAKIESKHQELNEDWLEVIIQQKKQSFQKKPHIQEMDWLKNMRQQAVEDKDSIQKKKESFCQNAPKETAENAVVKPVTEKRLPVKDIAWLREFKQKQEIDVDSEKAEIKTKCQELKYDWLEDTMANWVEMEKKSQEGWKEKARNLEKSLENEKVVAQQRQQELLRIKEEKEKAKNELVRIAIHRESGINAKQIVERANRKKEIEKAVLKGKESMREIEHKEGKRTDMGRNTIPGERAQEVISGAAEKTEEKAGGVAVKKDKSVRRRFLGWVNEKAKEYYSNKIQKTLKREQEEGDQVYQSCEISKVFFFFCLTHTCMGSSM